MLLTFYNKLTTPFCISRIAARNTKTVGIVKERDMNMSPAIMTSNTEAICSEMTKKRPLMNRMNARNIIIEDEPM